MKRKRKILIYKRLEKQLPRNKQFLKSQRHQSISGLVKWKWQICIKVVLVVFVTDVDSLANDKLPSTGRVLSFPTTRCELNHGHSNELWA